MLTEKKISQSIPNGNMILYRKRGEVIIFPVIGGRCLGCVLCLPCTQCLQGRERRDKKPPPQPTENLVLQILCSNCNNSCTCRNPSCTLSSRDQRLHLGNYPWKWKIHSSSQFRRSPTSMAGMAGKTLWNSSWKWKNSRSNSTETTFLIMFSLLSMSLRTAEVM